MKILKISIRMKTVRDAPDLSKLILVWNNSEGLEDYHSNITSSFESGWGLNFDGNTDFTQILYVISQPNPSQTNKIWMNSKWS